MTFMKWKPVLWALLCGCLSAVLQVVEANPNPKKRKLCEYLECQRGAVTRGLCIAHGGGKRCGFEGCQKSRQSGGFCVTHGGGTRCRLEGCRRARL